MTIGFGSSLIEALCSTDELWTKPVTTHIRLIDWLRSWDDLLANLAGARTRSIARNPPFIAPAADLSDVYADLDAGRTLLIDNADAANEKLGMIAPAVCDWLGITSRACTVKLSVSPTGSGLFAHFDQHDSIQVQLSGAKLWRVSPTPAVRWPLDPHVVETEPTEELRKYCDSEDLRPHELKNFELNPGDVLTVPRGCWHETHAVGPSIGLIVCLAVGSWVDLLKRHHRRDAVADAAWREPMYGAWSAGVLTPAARERIRSLLETSFDGDASVLRPEYSDVDAER